MGIKEKVLMIITIILLVIMIGMACYSVYNGKKENENNQNIINGIDLNQTTEANTVEENEPTNTETETENIVNEIVTPTIQPNVTEEEINSDYVGTEEQQTVHIEQTEEEKAIELVKNDYGTDQGVSFNIENKEGTIYHISVRDINTTGALAWYDVDISTNTVTRK